MIASPVRRRRATAVLLAALAGVPAGQAGGARPARSIELSGDYTVPIVLGGRAARLKVAADALKWPVLNGSLASALNLRSGPFKGSGRSEDGERFTISSKVVRNQYGGTRKRQRALWLDRDVFAGADGVVGPTGIGFDVVRMVLRPAMPGERVTTHKLQGVPLFGLVVAAFEIEVGGARVPVTFNLDRHDTLVSASTGKLLADAFGGALSGDPVRYTLFDGKVRPGRRLVLARPFAIDGREVRAIAVRVRPEARTDIPEAAAAPDPDEVADGADEVPGDVVVTAHRRRKPRQAITLGTDYLQGCSSITYDLRARTVALSCA